MDFRRKIIELISKCSDNELLELVYRFCKKTHGLGDHPSPFCLPTFSPASPELPSHRLRALRALR